MKHFYIISLLSFTLILSPDKNTAESGRVPGSAVVNKLTNTMSQRSKHDLVENPGFEILDPSTGLPEGWFTKIHREEIATSL
jgi:hypothetical protein